MKHERLVEASFTDRLIMDKVFRVCDSVVNTDQLLATRKFCDLASKKVEHPISKIYCTIAYRALRKRLFKRGD